MIAVDTSAIFACLIREAGSERLLDTLYDAQAVIMGAPTRLEFSIVTYRRGGQQLERDAERLVEQLAVEIVAFGHDELAIAQDAFLRFGKGTGHPAQLNYGDCMSYAVAQSRSLPLLFKGDDFRRTDITAAR